MGKTGGMSKTLVTRNLVDSSLVAPSFKGCIQEGHEDLIYFFVVQKTTWKRENIGIVVCSCVIGNFRIPAQCRPDPLMLVHRHIDTVSGGAYGNSRITFASFNSRCQWMCIVGIISAV